MPALNAMLSDAQQKLWPLCQAKAGWQHAWTFYQPCQQKLGEVGKLLSKLPGGGGFGSSASGHGTIIVLQAADLTAVPDETDALSIVKQAMTKSGFKITEARSWTRDDTGRGVWVIKWTVKW